MEEPTSRVYLCQRNLHRGGKRVTIIVADMTDSRVVREKELLPEESQKIRNYSTEGFEWGYRGPGPLQLALAILWDYTRSKTKAKELAEGFESSFIVNVKKEGFQINQSEIEEFLGRHIKT